jgi:DNA-binding PadR family transcriptional regulator
MKFDQDLIRGMAETIILKLLSEGPLYGYMIIKTANERSKGAFEWKEGTLYPCLHRLEAAGLIEGDWQLANNGRNRKYYAVTAKGRELVAAKLQEWAAFSKAVDDTLGKA